MIKLTHINKSIWDSVRNFVWRSVLFSVILPIWEFVYISYLDSFPFVMFSGQKFLPIFIEKILSKNPNSLDKGI